MQEQPSEPTGATSLKRVLGQAVALLRGSDTIHWLTTEVADGLHKRARVRTGEIVEARAALERTDSKSVRAFDDAVRFAKAEAGAQDTLARLRSQPSTTEGDA